MVSPQTQEAEVFLQAYRRIQPAPDQLARKSDLRPEAFFECLGNVFIVEAKARGFQFRLFGTRIVEVTGVDHTGDYLHDVLQSDDHDHVAALLQRCLSDRLGILSTERLLYPGKEYVEVEILRTPWLDTMGEPRFVAGTLARLERPGESFGMKVRSLRDIEIVRDSAPRQEFSLHDGSENEEVVPRVGRRSR